MFSTTYNLPAHVLFQHQNVEIVTTSHNNVDITWKQTPFLDKVLLQVINYNLTDQFYSNH